MVTGYRQKEKDWYKITYDMIYEIFRDTPSILTSTAFELEIDFDQRINERADDLFKAVQHYHVFDSRIFSKLESIRQDLSPEIF